MCINQKHYQPANGMKKSHVNTARDGTGKTWKFDANMCSPAFNSEISKYFYASQIKMCDAQAAAMERTDLLCSHSS
jgi:hypothetical protein